MLIHPSSTHRIPIPSTYTKSDILPILLLLLGLKLSIRDGDEGDVSFKGLICQIDNAIDKSMLGIGIRVLFQACGLDALQSLREGVNPLQEGVPLRQQLLLW